MSKGKGMRGAPMPRMNSADSQNAFQSLQQKMLETQDALATEIVETSVGGGAVKVVITGQQKIQAIEISADAMTAGDKEMLQDLMVAAVNEAIAKSQELAATRLSALTGGLNLPGLL